MNATDNGPYRLEILEIEGTESRVLWTNEGQVTLGEQHSFEFSVSLNNDGTIALSETSPLLVELDTNKGPGLNEQTLTFSWASQNGKNYSILGTDNLATSLEEWHIVKSAISDEEGLTTVETVIEEQDTRQFFVIQEN